ncbi:MAG: prepilin-type N-terminal cleavage/methylation domain-containing protein, partial [Thermoleophilia bacterium]|nr:prepilin-type N-terminal cleavage/methylation domain-containing protein [Thermoleophilia bacterium]
MRPRNEQGFTLVELIIVLVIVAILMAVAMSS